MTIEDQPPPIPNESVPIWDLVIKDMQERDHVGRERYGTPLQTNNGRDMLVDAYQEALDLVFYLRGRIEEDSQKPLVSTVRLHWVNAEPLPEGFIDHIPEPHYTSDGGVWRCGKCRLKIKLVPENSVLDT